MRIKKDSKGGKKELSALEIKAMSKAGLHAVGTVSGLCLKVDAAGNKSWVLRVLIGGRRRSMGLGGYPSVTLAEACDKARKARNLIDEGIDPIGHRQKLKEGSATVTFAKAAELFIENKSPEWKNEKHIAQWRNTIKDSCKSISSKDVSQIETHHIRQLLEDIWLTKTETASRLRGRIEAILDWATVNKYRKGDNPARWSGHLEHLLASPKKIHKVEHHGALPWKDMPQFVKLLRTKGGIGQRCLEFVLLTLCRTSEAIESTWDEIDFDKKTWTIPATRTKQKKIHIVALSSVAIDLLNSIERNSKYIFSHNGKTPISQDTMQISLKRMAKEMASLKGCAVHGFRSSYRDWAAETTNFSHDIMETVLGHKVGSSVELAYKRTNFLEQRYPLMEDWASFIYKEVI